MNSVMEVLPGTISYVICGLATVHAVGFVVLWRWSKRDYRSQYRLLEDFTSGLSHRSRLSVGGHIADQVDAFLADIRDVLSRNPTDSSRQTLTDRVYVLDERRDYLNSMSFEKWTNMARTVIEVYPLLGILGTILAVAAALPALEVNEAGAMTDIMRLFGAAIWSTIWGLGAAIVLMWANSWLEPEYSRLAEIRIQVRDVVAQAKRELGGDAGS
ncbi:MAG: MotA/TolQ/ExbB proton channel family protein [Planctomycetaceae bacterium]